MGFLKLLARNWSKLAFGALVLLIAVPVLEGWWKTHKAEAAAQEKKAALESLGADASITGALYWGAYKACAKIGIPDVERCAKYKGILLQEKAAPVHATMAIGRRLAYDKNCQALYAKDYCDQLLNRAFHLSQNEP